MTQRKKLLLSIIPFAIVGIAGIYLLQLTKSTKDAELQQLIDEPIKKIRGIDLHSPAYGGTIKTSSLIFHPSGFYNEADLSRLAGGKQKPYDRLLIGHLRIVIPSKPRDWSNSGQPAEYLVSVPTSSRSILTTKNGSIYTPVHGPSDSRAFKVVTTLDGCRIIALEHDLKLVTTDKKLSLSGQEFDLFGQPTVIILDSSYNVIDVHKQR